MLHFPCCAKLLKDPTSKISLYIVAFSLGAGPQKMLTVSLTTARKKLYLYLTFLKVLLETKCVP